MQFSNGESDIDVQLISNKISSDFQLTILITKLLSGYTLLNWRVKLRISAAAPDQ